MRSLHKPKGGFEQLRQVLSRPLRDPGIRTALLALLPILNSCEFAPPKERSNKTPDTADTARECQDEDRDGFSGETEACPEGDDCDDSDPQVGSLRTWYADADSDGYGNPALSQENCREPEAYVLDPSDCDDSDASTSPAATEVCDGLDNDCGTSDLACPMTEENLFTLQGTRQNGNFGASVVSGDLSGDGRGDVIVGAPGIEEGAGAIYLYETLGNHSDREADATLNPVDSVPQGMGKSLDLLDADDDGYMELVGGLPELEEGTGGVFWAGALGGSFDTPTTLLGSPESSAGTLVVAGNLDAGTLKDDLVILGSPEEESGRTAHLVFNLGMATNLRGDVAIELEDARIPSHFGSAAVLDLNGDGVTDLAMGIPDADRDAGAALLLEGPFGADATLTLEDGILLNSEDEGSSLGAAVVSVNDLTGDGEADLAIGQPYTAEGGSLYATAWVVSALPTADTSINEAGLSIAGEGTWGTSIAATGDVNLDGQADVGIANPETGKAYGFYGPIEGPLTRADAALTLESGTGELRLFSYSPETIGGGLALGLPEEPYSSGSSTILNAGKVDLYRGAYE